MAYLFGEVAKCFYLVHHPEDWIEYVMHSQRGDCSVTIDVDSLPSRKEMEQELEWEQGYSGPDRLNRWLEESLISRIAGALFVNVFVALSLILFRFDLGDSMILVRYLFTGTFG